MKDADFIHEALSKFCTPVSFDGIWTVPTHCLYPSNGAVSVYVSGGPSGAVVSDGGRAVHVLLEHNRIVPNPDRYLFRFCKQSGLKAHDGRIFSPAVEIHQLTAAVMLVANASSVAARWGVDNLKIAKKRDLRRDLYSLLIHEFPRERVIQEARLAGRSNRQYRFDHVVDLNHYRKLVVDAVLPDANSINSHAIAHLDLAQRGDKNIIQRMVYDSDDEWRSEDLNLLQMAAHLVPFSQFPDSLKRTMMH